MGARFCMHHGAVASVIAQYVTPKDAEPNDEAARKLPKLCGWEGEVRWRIGFGFSCP